MEPTLAQWIDGGARIPDGRGHRVFVRQDGPTGGAPVTLLHGFPSSSHDWARIVPALVDAGMRVTTLDFLGFGASDKPVAHRYRLGGQADLVERVWDGLGIGSTALIAHDYGVSVAQELLARNTARITRMGWLNGGLYPDLHRPIAVQKLLHGPLGPALALLSNERSYQASLRAILGQPVSDDVLHELWAATSRGGGRRVQWQLLRYIDERRAHADRWRGALESYPGPTLFLWGPADPISGGHVLPRLRERLPGARFEVLDGVGHYPQLEAPAAVRRALAEFLVADPA
jgi:pimeloyl-ACP methyl ester carboxylesterase